MRYIHIATGTAVEFGGPLPRAQYEPCEAEWTPEEAYGPDMTKAELIEFAARNNVSIGAKATKSQVLEAIRAARGQR